MQADITFNPLGAHTKTVATALSIATTLSTPERATKILVQAFTANIRFTLDGSTPTSVNGFEVAISNPPMLIPLVSGKSLKLIEAATSAVINYQYGN